MSSQQHELTGAMQAAILIMNLDKNDASDILKYLGPKQIQKLGQAMASLESVDKEQQEKVLQDFLEEVDLQTAIGVDNDAYIREVLTNALGHEKASTMLERILRGGETKGLDTLKWMEPKAVLEILRHEHPQIQAIILSYLESEQAASILTLFDAEHRLDLLLRISNLKSVHPVAITELNDSLEKQFAGKASGATKAVGGLQTAANLMNLLDSAIENELITQLKETDPELGVKIQDLMFVFENLIDVDDRGIQTLLREISSDVLILALKGADVEVQSKIFNNMSKRAAELLRDDLEAKGPVRVSDVEAAQKEILAVAKRLADSGQIMLGGKGEEMI